MKILGIHYGGHDTSACITINGRLIAACEEERYNKEKHTRQFPVNAINDCLKISKLNIKDIDILSLSNDPYLQIKEKYLRPALDNDYRINSVINDISRIKKLYYIEEFLRKKTKFKKKIEFNNHHLCHLASAFYPSGFKKSLIVSYDGIGEINSALFAIGEKNKIKVLHDKNKYPDSLGLFYTAITFFLGWETYCDEGIIMGLAPFGNSKKKVPGTKNSYLYYFRKILYLDKNDSLSYKINLDWIDYHKERDKWVSKKFYKIFGKKRILEDKITEHHKNIAAALQDRLEEIVLKQLKILKKKTKIKKLCISGGVGLNCSLNGKISKSGIFDEIFVQPASGDAGTSYGSCLVSEINNNKKIIFKKNVNFYVGYREGDSAIKKNINKSKLKFKKLGDKVYEKTAELLSSGKIIAWFQDGAEFGPRALGNRSILAKPFPVNMRDHINLKVKFREYFRPFAPAVLEENLKEYFILDQTSPHMLIACQAKQSAINKIPAVVHVDNSCRVQTVSKDNNYKFWNLLKQFKIKTQVPVLLNTSFNIKGQPIVNTSQDAIECFKKYKIDNLVINDFILYK